MYHYVLVDVFTGTPLEGNPLAVFLDASGLSAGLMQRIAREMNLSETTFVLPPEGSGDARVRIFTPVNELRFAGHPALGTAVVLGLPAGAERGSIVLETGMGPVPVELHRTAPRVGSGSMLQPLPRWEPYDRAEELLAALGLRSSTLPVEIYTNGPRHAYVGLPDSAALGRLRPDGRALAELPDMAANCFAGAGDHWELRMFSPAYGVVEDAATGSAAGPLAVHLARHGLAPYGRRIEIRQGLRIGRPATLRATAEGGPDRLDRVRVSGEVVEVARGELRL